MAVRIRDIFCVVLGIGCLVDARSIYRTSSDKVPRITTRWLDEERTYVLQHPNLEVGPLFTNYDADYLAQYYFPEDVLKPRIVQAGQALVRGEEVTKILEDFVVELQKSVSIRAHYKDVTIIKKKDYNPRSHTGLIIVRFKNYPFVAKLFMETPASFVSPFSKGFEPAIFFMMGSINRHLSGFLRIKNAEVLRAFISDSVYWSSRVDIPRKWFWQPKHQRFIDVTSANLGSHEHHVIIPSIYAVIADAIVPDHHFRIFNREHREKALGFCHFVGIRVDPHINNFMIEQGTGRLILVDTEHFPSMVGLRESFSFESYTDWYFKLSCKGFIDCFGRTKDVRERIQSSDERLVLDC
jgi:hypothetical protein